MSEKYVRVVNDMYRDARTKVRSSVGVTEKQMKVGLHQGSAMSPYIFDMVMDVIVAEVNDEVPWSVLFADDIVYVSTSKEEAEATLKLWRRALEERGLKISRANTEYMWMDVEDQSENIAYKQQK